MFGYDDFAETFDSEMYCKVQMFTLTAAYHELAWRTFGPENVPVHMKENMNRLLNTIIDGQIDEGADEQDAIDIAHTFILDYTIGHMLMN